MLVQKGVSQEVFLGTDVLKKLGFYWRYHRPIGNWTVAVAACITRCSINGTRTR